MPTTAANDANRIVVSNAGGMKLTQALYGRPPTFMG